MIVNGFVSSISFRKNVVLVGGTAATMAACYLQQQEFSEKEINDLHLETMDLSIFESEILKVPNDELIKRYSLLEKRIDSIKQGIKTYAIL